MSIRDKLNSSSVNLYQFSGLHNDSVLCCDIFKRNDSVISGGIDGKICIWSLSNQYAIDSDSPVSSLKVFDEDTQLIVGRSDFQVSLIDLETGVTTKEWKGLHEGVVNDLWVVDEKNFGSVSDDGYFKMTSIYEKNSSLSIKTTFPLFTVLKQKDYLYLSGLEPIIKVYDVRYIDKEFFQIDTLHSNSISSIAMSSNFKLSSLSFDNTLRFYDGDPTITKDNRILSSNIQLPNVNDSKFLCRNTFLDKDKFISAYGYIFDVADQNLISDELFKNQQGQVIDTCFNSEENKLVTTSTDSTLLVKFF